MNEMHHDRDFYAWTREQAALLRAGAFDRLDTEHLIEELENMGARERRELVSRLAVLLAHLLKWRYQPERRSRSWQATIEVQRLDLADLLAENPSLKALLPELFAKAWRRAVILAVAETGLPKSTFPSAPEIFPEQALDEDFWPEA